MRKWLVVATLVLMMISFLGSVANGSQVIRIRLAHVQPPGDTTDLVAHRIADLVKERSRGRIVVEVFPSGVMGGDRDILESLGVGALEMTIGGSNAVHWYAPEYSIVDAPYVFKDKGHVRKVWDGPIGDEVKAALERKANIVTPAVFNRGGRLLTANRPIRTVADLKGLKIRLPELPLWLDVWKALGAMPTPIAFPELFGALQTGVVDAQENPIELIYTSRFFEVQKYLMLTYHVYGQNVIHISKPFFNRLSESDKKLLVETCKDAAAYGDQVQAQYEKELIDKCAERGMTIVEVDREAFRKIALTVAEKWQQTTWRKGLLQDVLSLGD